MMTFYSDLTLWVWFMGVALRAVWGEFSMLWEGFPWNGFAMLWGGVPMEWVCHAVGRGSHGMGLPCCGEGFPWNGFAMLWGGVSPVLCMWEGFPWPRAVGWGFESYICIVIIQLRALRATF